MRDNAELKPCPFCGATPLLEACGEPFVTLWKVKCSSCGMETDMDYHSQAVVDFWNTRVCDKKS